jgi:hypothetical protein
MSVQWSGSLVVSQRRRPRGVSYKGREMNKRGARPRERRERNTWNMSGAPGSIEASRSKTMSKRRQSSRATCPKPSTAPFTRTPTRSRSSGLREALGDGLRAEEQGRRRRSGEARRRVFVIAVCRQADLCATATRSWASPPRHRSMLSWRARDVTSFNGRELVIEVA